MAPDATIAQASANKTLLLFMSPIVYHISRRLASVREADSADNAPTGAHHEPLPACRAAFRRLRELKIENGKCRMMEVAPGATPQFYTLHFTFYISRVATPFRPSALGKPHRHEPGIRPTRTSSRSFDTSIASLRPEQSCCHNPPRLFHHCLTYCLSRR